MEVHPEETIFPKLLNFSLVTSFAVWIFSLCWIVSYAVFALVAMKFPNILVPKVIFYAVFEAT